MCNLETRSKGPLFLRQPLTAAEPTAAIRKTAFHWDDSNRTLTWKQEGAYQGEDIFQTIHVAVFDANGKLEEDDNLNSTGRVTLR
jgi:hypothetical protein